MARSCLTPTAVLLYALNETGGDLSFTGHVANCIRCREEVAETRRLLLAAAALPDRLPAGGGCLDEVALSRFAMRGMREADLETSDHLAGCAACRQNLIGLLEVLGDPAVAAEVQRLEAPPARPARRFLALAGAVAAVAAIVLVARPSEQARQPGHRGPTLTAADAPAVLLPQGDVAQAADFEWSSVIGADRYRLTLFRDD